MKMLVYLKFLLKKMFYESQINNRDRNSESLQCFKQEFKRIPRIRHEYVS